MDAYLPMASLAQASRRPFLLGRSDDDLFFAQLNGTDLIKQLVFAIHHRHRIAEEKTSIWHHVGIYWHSSDRSAFRRRRNFPACDLNGIIAGCKNRIAKNGSLNGDTAIPFRERNYRPLEIDQRMIQLLLFALQGAGQVSVETFLGELH